MNKSIKVNAALNVVKQIMQVVFPLITTPYITRVLLPENYGKINFGNSIISYILLIAGLGITPYAIREGSLIREKKSDFKTFSDQVFSINVVSMVIAYLILAILLLFVPYFQEYRVLLAIQGISVIFTTIGADWVNSIEEDYLYLTVRYIILHAISLVLMFLLVRDPEDYYIYAGITLVTSVGANLLNIFYIRKYVKINFTFDINWKRHLIPIIILFANSIAMTIYVSSDVTMLGFFKGDIEVGIYSISTKIYSVIKQILNAILVVSIPRLTSFISSHNYDSFKNLSEKILGVLVTIMCPMIVGIIVFRNEAIIVAGGNAFLAGSSSLCILTLAISVSLVATFYSSCVLMPLRMEKYILKGTVISAIINLLLNFVLIPLLGNTGAATTTLISEMYVAMYFYWLVKKEGYDLFNIRIFFLSIIGGVGVAIISLIMKLLLDNFIVYFTISVILSGIFYGSVHLFGRNPVLFDLIPRLKRKGYK